MLTKLSFCNKIQFVAIKHEQEKEKYKEAGEKGDFNGYELQIKDKIIESMWSIFSNDKVFIPIHHVRNRHYTLLVIDNCSKCFLHMNTKLPPRKEYTSDDTYFQNAMNVVSE